MSDATTVIWHDLECGGYQEDLLLWRSLADGHAGPILDIGAGTGRVTLALASAGHAVTALDHDPVLLAALRRRALQRGLEVATVRADARDFAVSEHYGLILVPMQTVQLLRDAGERTALLRCCARALATGGRVVLAIADALDCFEVAAGDPPPLPDVTEIDGTVYASRPLAVRADGDGFVLERRREAVSPAGQLRTTEDRVRLAALSADRLESEGEAAGLRVAPRSRVATTPDYVGSTVVVFDA